MAMGARAPAGAPAAEEGVARVRDAAGHLSRALPADIAVAAYVAPGAPIPAAPCVRHAVAGWSAGDGVAAGSAAVRGTPSVLEPGCGCRPGVVAANAAGRVPRAACRAAGPIAAEVEVAVCARGEGC